MTSFTSGFSQEVKIWKPVVDSLLHSVASENLLMLVRSCKDLQDSRNRWDSQQLWNWSSALTPDGKNPGRSHPLEFLFGCFGKKKSRVYSLKKNPKSRRIPMERPRAEDLHSLFSRYWTYSNMHEHAAFPEITGAFIFFSALLPSMIHSSGAAVSALLFYPNMASYGRFWCRCWPLFTYRVLCQTYLTHCQRNESEKLGCPRVQTQTSG